MCPTLLALLALAAPAPAKPIRPSDRLPEPDLVMLAAGDERAAAWIRQGKYTEAVRQLRRFTERDDLVSHRFHGVRRSYRDPSRRLLITRCLLAAGQRDAARRELRGLLESTAEPGYSFPEDAWPLLLDLETATRADHAAFEKWLARIWPVAPANHAGSIQELADLKKEISAGRFDRAAAYLTRWTPYNAYLAPRRLSAPMAYVERCLARQPGAVADLLDRTTARLASGEDCSVLGWIHCVGEIGDAGAIADLRRLRHAAKNYYVRLELLFALAKLGDRTILPDLLQAHAGNREHMRFIDQLLRWLTGTSRGDIASVEDGRVVFAAWRAWLHKQSMR